MCGYTLSSPERWRLYYHDHLCLVPPSSRVLVSGGLFPPMATSMAVHAVPHVLRDTRCPVTRVVRHPVSAWCRCWLEPAHQASVTPRQQCSTLPLQLGRKRPSVFFLPPFPRVFQCFSSRFQQSTAPVIFTLFTSNAPPPIHALLCPLPRLCVCCCALAPGVGHAHQGAGALPERAHQHRRLPGVTGRGSPGHVRCVAAVTLGWMKIQLCVRRGM